MSPFERWLTWTSAGLTTVTGLVYTWMKYFLEPVSEFAAINHPLQPFVLKAHILVAPILVFALGVISLRHMWAYYVNGAAKGRWSGIGTVWLAGVMIVTGYLVQGITADTLLRVIAYTHIGVGALFAVGFVLHSVFAANGTEPLDES